MWKPRQKLAPLKPKPYKSKAYLSWLHNKGLTCMICGASGIELHHLESGNRGRADNKVVPLCPTHHRTGNLSAHGFDAKMFKEMYGERMAEYADELFQEYEDGL